MKHPERFTRAIKALVDAFFGGYLAKFECHACAVGNICASALGVKKEQILNAMYKPSVDNRYELQYWAQWGHVFTTTQGIQKLVRSKYTGEAKKAIDSTGYSLIELAKVERAFENNTEINHESYDCYDESQIMQDQYNGLMAVVDVLCEIEGINQVNEVKELFAYTK